ncbi:MAG: hypothetical protein ABI743_01360 [bacterium]
MGIRLIFGSLLVGAALLMSGCGTGQFVTGDWHGTVTYGEGESATTQTVDWVIFNNPALDHASVVQRVIFNFSAEGGCDLEVDYDFLNFETDGSVTFPVKVVEANSCFPTIDEAELTDGGELQLVLTGGFDPDADTGDGTLKLQTHRGADVLTTYLDGTWHVVR